MAGDLDGHVGAGVRHDDDESVLEFEAAWALTMQNLSRGKREPLRPEEVRDLACSQAFRGSRAGLVAGATFRVARGRDLYKT